MPMLLHWLCRGLAATSWSVPVAALVSEVGQTCYGRAYGGVAAISQVADAVN